MAAGIVIALVWVLGWGSGSRRYGLGLMISAIAAATIVLGLLLSAWAEPAGMFGMGLMVGDGYSYQLGPGWYLVAAGAVATVALSIQTMVTVYGRASLG